MLNPGAARLFRDFSLRYIYIIWCIILCIYYVSKSICPQIRNYAPNMIQKRK